MFWTKAGLVAHNWVNYALFWSRSRRRHDARCIFTQTCIRPMSNKSTQSWQNVKMYCINHHKSVQLEYTNQFNYVTKYYHMNWLKSKEWLNDLIKSMNSNYICLSVSKNLFCCPFLESVRLRWHFFVIFWFNFTIPSKSIDLVSYFMKTN